jgi:hypothetical protein
VSNEEDLTPWLAGAITTILDEMFDRLSVDLSDPDLTAVSTAVQKAAMAGARNGAAAVHAQVREKGIALELTIDEVDYDDWAVRFGDETAD